MKFLYRMPLRQFEFINIEGETLKEVMEAVKKVTELLPTQHDFPKGKPRTLSNQESETTANSAGSTETAPNTNNQSSAPNAF